MHDPSQSDNIAETPEAVMSFCLLTVRCRDDPPTDLFPDLGVGRNRVGLLPTDGEVRYCEAGGLRVVTTDTRTSEELARLDGLTAGVMVTDSRVAVACSKFTQGGVWIGLGLIGLPLALLFTAVSQTSAARRRHGKMMVGHVRHEWLQFVDAADQKGPLRRNFLGLQLANPAGVGGLALTMILNTAYPAPVIAKEIAARAARLKAAHCPDPGESEVLLHYAERPAYHEYENGLRRFALPAPSSPSEAMT